MIVEERNAIWHGSLENACNVSYSVGAVKSIRDWFSGLRSAVQASWLFDVFVTWRDNGPCDEPKVMSDIFVSGSFGGLAAMQHL